MHKAVEVHFRSINYRVPKLGVLLCSSSGYIVLVCAPQLEGTDPGNVSGVGQKMRWAKKKISWTSIKMSREENKFCPGVGRLVR